MKPGDKVIVNENDPRNTEEFLKQGDLEIGYEYTVLEVVLDRIVLHGLEDQLFFASRFIPRAEYDTGICSLSEYQKFVELMKAYLNTIPAGSLREEAAQNIKGFWDFVDITYQKNLPEGSPLRTRSNKELGD